MHQAWRQTRSFRASQRARTRASFKRTHSWSITRRPSPSRVSSAQRRTSPSIRSMGPTGESAIRSRFSWLVISHHPSFSRPTSAEAGTRTSS